MILFFIFLCKIWFFIVWVAISIKESDKEFSKVKITSIDSIKSFGLSFFFGAWFGIAFDWIPRPGRKSIGKFFDIFSFFGLFTIALISTRKLSGPSMDFNAE